MGDLSFPRRRRTRQMVSYTNEAGEFITLFDLSMGIARYIEDEFVKYWNVGGKANTKVIW